MDGITLNGHFYSKQSLLTLNVKDEPRLLTKNEIDTLIFCQEWLKGKKEFIVHTSGSTGKPKPIRISREQMIISAKTTAKALALKTSDHSFICLPAQYVAGKMMLVRGFVLDLKMTIVEPSRDPFVGLSAEAYFDFTALVPMQLKSILNSPQSRRCLDAMKAVLIGGGPVSDELYENLQCIKAPLFHSYGMTETVSHIALRPLNGKKKSKAFFPLDDVAIDINAEGCLTIRAPVIHNELIHTNDKVEILPNHSFVWLGRKDNIAVSSSGLKIQLEKVERVFEDILNDTDDAYARKVRFSVLLDVDEATEPHVYIVIEDYTFPSELEKEIKQRLQTHLNKYEMPQCFFYLQSLPETATGKIDKRAIIKLLKIKSLL